MGDGLCWKCKESLRELYTKESFLKVRNREPWIHCHHEPGKKPKCWCVDKVNGTKTFVETFGSLNGEVIYPDFCPQCGNKLVGD